MKIIFKRTISLCIIAAMLISLVPCMASAAMNINIGEYVQMGTYYGEPILWRCVDIDEKGPLMLADKILCIKAFDAEASANTTTGSHSRRNYESNYWGDSNMRSWLNSTASAGNVTWLCGNPPIKKELWNGYNAYDKEAGFLSNFTQSERNAMKEVTQKSLLSWPEIDAGMATTGTEQHNYDYDIYDVVQNYDNAYAENVTDKMFLLDVKQVNEVYNNSNILGDNYYIGEPTAECVENSEYKSSSLATGEKWYYWLRSPDSYYNYSVRYVYSSGGVYYSIALHGYIGVRPAFYLDTAVKFTAGDGTAAEPYKIDGGEVTPDSETSMSFDNGVLTVKTNEVGEAYLYIAYFDENNIFVKCGIKKLSLKNGENTVTVDDLTTGSNVKLMLWDKNMQLMCEYIIVK